MVCSDPIPNIRRRAGCRRWSGVVLALATVGCAQDPGVLFEPLDPPLLWPSPPQPTRISYVGEIRTSADLKAGRSWWESLADTVLGEEEPDALFGPRAVAVAEGRFVWVADPGGRCLHQFDLVDRTYQRIDRAGEMPLLSPVGVCLGGDDTVFVCDSESVAIHRFDASDGALRESLTLDPAVARPVAASWDPVAGELYVVDVLSHDVKVLDSRGVLLRTIGRRGSAPGELNYPCDIVRDRDNLLWVVDTGNYRVQGLARDGSPVVVIGGQGDAPGDMAMPKSIAVDSDGHLYVVDSRFENVQIFDRAGRLLLFFGEEGTGPGEFWLPGGIFIDSLDQVWICDAYNRRLQVFAYHSVPEDASAAR